MATRITRELICDLCESDDDVTHVAIQVNKGGVPRKASADLCAVDRAPYELLLEKFGGRRGRKPGGLRVVTEAEVRAARKKAQKAVPAKTAR